MAHWLNDIQNYSLLNTAKNASLDEKKTMEI